MKNKIAIFLLLFCISCSAWRYGYSYDLAQNSYLVVDSKNENFGYKRLSYMSGFRSSLGAFVSSHGDPEMIYEFKDQNGRDGVRLYYINVGKVYEFIEANWRPNSIYLREDREITEQDKAIYAGALKDESLKGKD